MLRRGTTNKLATALALFICGVQILSFLTALFTPKVAFAQVDDPELKKCNTVAAAKFGLSSTITTTKTADKKIEIKSTVSLKKTASGVTKTPDATIWVSANEHALRVVSLLTLSNPNTSGDSKVWSNTSEDTPTAEGNYEYYIIAKAQSNGTTYVSCTSIPQEITKDIADASKADGSSDSASTGPKISSTPKDIDKATAEKWMAPFGTVHIIVDESKPEEVPAPYVSVKADTALGRPALKFLLSSSEMEGNIVVANHKWLYFQAYEVDGETLTPVNGLAFMTDDDADNNYFVYTAAGASITDIVGSGLNTSNAFVLNSKALSIPDPEVNKVFAYIMDAPKTEGTLVGGDCATGGKWLTGPTASGVEGKTVYEIDSKHDDISFPKPSELNSNCVDKESTGWLAKWKVSITDVTGIGGCGLTGLVAIVQKGIGEGVMKIIACVFSTVLDAALKQVESFINAIAGYSYLGPTQVKPNRTLAFLGVGSAHASNLQDELSPPTGTKSSVIEVWKVSRSLLNIVVIIALLAIAFANILHLNINTYAAKKALPGLVIGVIGANASLLIIRFLVDAASGVAQLSLDLTSSAGYASLIGSFLGAIGKTAMTNGVVLLAGAALGPILAIVIIIFVIYYLFLIIVFAWALFKRLAILYLLIMLAPLAFAAYGIPTLQKYFTQWWDTFLRQLFLLPVIFIGMALVIKLSDAIKISANPFSDFSSVGFINLIIIMAAATAILKLPKTFTKGVIDVTDAAKKAFGMAKAIPQARMTEVQNWGNNKDKSHWANKMVNSRSFGVLHGATAIAGNPEMIPELYKKRVDFNEKNRKRGFGRTKIGDALLYGQNKGRLRTGLKEIIQGRPTTFSEDLPDAKTNAQARTVSEVLNDLRPDKKGDYDSYAKGIEQFATDKGKSADEVLRKIVGGTNKEVAEFGDGAGRASRRSASESTEAVAALKAIFNDERQAIRRNPDNKGMKGEQVDEEAYKSLWAKINGLTASPVGGPGPGPIPPPPGGSSPSPAGGPGFSPAGGPGGPIPSAASAIDQQIEDRINQVFHHGQMVGPNINDEIHGRILDSLDGLEGITQGDTNYQAAADKSRQALLEAVGNQTSADATELIEDIKTADKQRLVELSKHFSIAATAQGMGGDVRESIASIIRANEGYNQVANQATSGIDYARLEAVLAAAMAKGTEDIGSVISQELNPQFKQLTEALGKTFNADTQKTLSASLGNELRLAMAGPGPKSLSNILRTQLVPSLGKTVAKSLGVHTMTHQELTTSARPAVEVTHDSPPAPPPVPPSTPPPGVS